MATRIYLPATASTTPISPSPDAAWEDVSILARVFARTTKVNDTLATVAFTDSNSADRDILFRQYVTPLAPGQTITGAQALKFQVRAIETTTGNNMFTALGIRIIASDGSTVRKTVLAVTRDANEASATTLTNRQFTATSAAGNYTTVDGDYLVIEIGTAGDPSGGNPHSSSLRLGDSAASDLSEDDTSTTDNNPWVELADTLTVGVSTAAGSGSMAVNATGVPGFTGSASMAMAASGVGDFIAAVTNSRTVRFAFELFEDEQGRALRSVSSDAESDGSSSISIAASGVGAAEAQSTASASLTFSSTATGESVAVADGACALVIACSGGGAAAAEATASSAVTFSASGVGEFAVPVSRTVRFAFELFTDEQSQPVASAANIQQGNGSAAVVFGASGIGASVFDGVGAASIAVSVSGVGASSAQAVGSAAVTFSVTGAGISTAVSTGTSSVVFSAAGTGVSDSRAAGSSSLAFAASGVGTAVSASSRMVRFAFVLFDDEQGMPRESASNSSSGTGSCSITISCSGVGSADALSAGTGSITWLLTAVGDSASARPNFSFELFDDEQIYFARRATSVSEADGSAVITFTASATGAADHAAAGSVSFAFSADANSDSAAGTGSSAIVFAAPAVGAADAVAAGSASVAFAASGALAADANTVGSSSFQFAASGAGGGTGDADGVAAIAIQATASGASVAEAAGTASFAFGTSAVGAAASAGAGSAAFAFSASAGISGEGVGSAALVLSVTASGAADGLADGSATITISIQGDAASIAAAIGSAEISTLDSVAVGASVAESVGAVSMLFSGSGLPEGAGGGQAALVFVVNGVGVGSFTRAMARRLLSTDIDVGSRRSVTIEKGLVLVGDD